MAILIKNKTGAPIVVKVQQPSYEPRRFPVHPGSALVIPLACARNGLKVVAP